MVSFSNRFGFWLSFGAALLVFWGNFLPPLRWGLTQFLFSYEFGFMRRGLFGEFLSLLFPGDVKLAQLYGVAYVMSLMTLVTLFAFLARRFMSLTGGGQVLVLFATSLGFAAFVGNTGHLDSLLLIATILALSLPVNLTGLIVRSGIVTVMPLVHENMLPYFTVLIAFDVWLGLAGKNSALRLAIPMLLIAMGLATVLLIFRYGMFDFDEVWWPQFQVQLKSSDFETLNIAFEPVTRFPPGVESPLDHVFRSPFYVFRLIFFGGIGLAVLSLHLVPLLRAIKTQEWLTKLGVVAVVFAPLSLLFVAYDVSRFVGIAMINLFLVIAVMIHRLPQIAQATSPIFSPNLFLIILVLNGHMGLRQLNEYWSVRGAEFPASVISQSRWFILPEERKK